MIKYRLTVLELKRPTYSEDNEAKEIETRVYYSERGLLEAVQSCLPTLGGEYDKWLEVHVDENPDDLAIYATDAGLEACKRAIVEGYTAFGEEMDLNDEGLDCLRIVCDPIFANEKLSGDQIDPSDMPIWRSLEALGFVEIKEATPERDQTGS